MKSRIKATVVKSLQFEPKQNKKLINNRVSTKSKMANTNKKIFRGGRP